MIYFHWEGNFSTINNNIEMLISKYIRLWIKFITKNLFLEMYRFFSFKKKERKNGTSLSNQKYCCLDNFSKNLMVKSINQSISFIKRNPLKNFVLLDLEKLQPKPTQYFVKPLESFFCIQNTLDHVQNISHKIKENSRKHNKWKEIHYWQKLN